MTNKYGCPRGAKKIKGKCRSIDILCYHSRCGHPVLHENEKGKLFIMGRKKGGGVKRVYLNKKGNVPISQQVKPGMKKRLFKRTNGWHSKVMAE